MKKTNLISILMDNKGKVLGFALFISVGTFAYIKYKEPEKFEEKTGDEQLAYKEALILKSALNVGNGFWAWFEDENQVIKTLNETSANLNLIIAEYRKLTGNELFDDISKYLTPKQIEKIKSPFAQSKFKK